jgi:hypothetical protein
MSTPIPKGQELTGAITKHMDRRFLSSIDLAGQGVVELEIDRIEKLDELKYDNGQRETNAILCYFKSPKDRPLVLKATHIKAITRRLKTNNVQDWVGAKIPFHAIEERAFGEMQLCVRVAKT